MDLLFGLGQVICIVGLLYGAYLSITYVDREDAPGVDRAEPPPETKPRAMPRTGYDALTSHVWTAARPSLHDRLRAL